MYHVQTKMNIIWNLNNANHYYNAIIINVESYT